jgi:hypothetical protein
MKNSKKGLQVCQNGALGPVKNDEEKKLSLSGRRPAEKMTITNPNSIERNRHRIMMNFLSPLTGFMNMIYKKIRGKNSGLNKVFGHNIREALAGHYPKFEIDLNKVIISTGDLPNPWFMSFSSPSVGKISFFWLDDNGFDGSLPTDKMFIAVFNTNTRSWSAELDAARRMDCRCEMDVLEFRGKNVRVYLGFVTEDLARTSTSEYLGSVKVY